MVQSGGITFFMQNEETGEIEAYSVTIKFDPEDGPEITDNLGNSYIKEE